MNKMAKKWSYGDVLSHVIQVVHRDKISETRIFEICLILTNTIFENIMRNTDFSSEQYSFRKMSLIIKKLKTKVFSRTVFDLRQGGEDAER